MPMRPLPVRNTGRATADSTANSTESNSVTTVRQGLGYRIFLVRRYMSMDIILPYVVWITLLAVS